MSHITRLLIPAVVLQVLAAGRLCEAAIDAQDCPPVVFVKRQHFDRPFGIGTMIAWDIYKPGGGIYLYDPKHPDRPAREIFRRDDGVVFDLSLSYNAKKLLFSWRKCSRHTNTKGILSVSRLWRLDTLDHILELSEPPNSHQKPNHSFWDRKGAAEWAQVTFSRPEKLSRISVYWFDDQPTGGCAVPQSWRLLYKTADTWKPVETTDPYTTEKDRWNPLTFKQIETTALTIELQSRPGKSSGIQRWRLGTDASHAAILERARTDDPGELEDCFHIYEINLDGTALRQITDGPYQDIHPFYLPDGRIGFVSTRVKSYALCQPGAGCALHVMNPDGSDIRRIHFGTLADHSPFVLDDGSILFTRWEYQDKDLTYLQGLWTISPAGNRVQLFYGNTIFEPAVIWQAKPIPDTSNVLCTLAPHHGRPVGAIGIIDRSRGLENPLAITNLTPEIDYDPARNARGPGDRQYPFSYRDPYPIGQHLFVVADGTQHNRYRLALMDDQGRKQLLYEDPAVSCFNPVPLTPRKPPHTVYADKPGAGDSGTFFIADIYRGLTGVRRSRVAAVRIMKVIPKPCNMRGKRAYDMDPIMSRGTYYAKYCLGTVPVTPEGSACFKAPAGEEIYFQALDADGRELCRMGSVTQLVPGEIQSCIGCHESRFTAPPNNAAAMTAAAAGPLEIRPPSWGAVPMDFVRHVQPVFDRYCASCHSGADPAAGIDLSGDKTRFFNMAYDHLTQRRLVNFYWLLDEAPVRNFRPLESGSLVSRLVELIESDHADVRVDDESRRRIFTWIEANVPYYGTYDHTRPGTSGSRDAVVGAEWFDRFERPYNKRCRSCHGDFYTKNSGLHHTWINLTHPDLSRALTAPLARKAGGLELCKPQNGNRPELFADKSDPDYRTMLGAIEQGRTLLYANPRMDMPGASPVPYPTDYAGPFNTFAGP